MVPSLISGTVQKNVSIEGELGTWSKYGSGKYLKNRGKGSRQHVVWKPGLCC